MISLFDQFNREIKPEKKPEQDIVSTATIYDNEPGFQSAGLTPLRLGNILREATLGEPLRAMELFEEFEEKDTHLLSVLSKRRGRISGLNYKVEPASQDKKDLEIAEFILEVIEGLPDFEDNIKDITDAIGKGYAGLELCWDLQGSRHVVKNMIRVEPRRFMWRKLSNPPRLLTDSDSVEGVELKPFKFLFHVHKTKSGHATRQGLLRVCSWMYLFKNFGVRDWVKFAEGYGMPMRIGKYPSGAKKDEKDQLIAALRYLASDAAAIIPEGAAIELIEATQKAGSDPYKPLADFANAEISKAVLGQTLTTEQGDKGSRSLGTVHENTEDDLQKDDCEQVSKSIRRDFIRPLVGFNFGWDVPLPWIHFEYESEEDLLAEAQRYKTHLESGVEIPANHYYEKFKIPKPEKGEEVLGGRSPVEQGRKEEPEEEAQEDAEESASKEQFYSATEQPETDDNLQGFLDRLLKEAGQESLIDPVQDLLLSSKSLEEFRDGLLDLYTEIPVDQMGAVIQKAFESSELLGRFESLPDDEKEDA
ncbi:MAG: DUF935 domain-containing protein [Candidatus Nitronauta litoralis]|uniref:DUF935 domain-containing protein n=1 Tax=Candidatus Nitronauta litoralis TaxID=2705533 RepID=A0A7T0BVQ1_9BACT|nr:MAG: DUF935 domain-containing protein [Candidatus Nitronauta litoralis]